MIEKLANSKSVEGEGNDGWISNFFIEPKTGLRINIKRLENFDLLGELEKRKDKFVEVAGPTERGFMFYDFKEGEEPKRLNLLDYISKDKMYVSNLFKGVAHWNPNTGEFLGIENSVDFRADAKKLPLKDESIGAFFGSCLGSFPLSALADIRMKMPSEAVQSDEYAEDGITNVFREKALKEAMRVLKKDGLLVWQGGKLSDTEFAKQLGFEIGHQEEYRYSTGQSSFSIVFIKKEKV